MDKKLGEEFNANSYERLEQRNSPFLSLAVEIDMELAESELASREERRKEFI